MKVLYDPLAIFGQGDAKGNSCPIKQFRVSIAAGATADLVPLVTGRVIRILTLNVFAATAVVDFNLQSNAVIGFDDWALYQARNFWKAEKIGLFDSVISQPARAQVGAASAARFAGRYIELIP